MLHGLARTPASLSKMASILERDGYAVINLGYDSRHAPIETLSAKAVQESLDACPAENRKIHFVTHSLGGILLRYYLESNEIPALGRVVMLAPPNQGSHVVDVFRHLPGYRLLNGPAGMQLGTGKDSLPLSLGAVNFSLGVIAGNRSINIILSQFLENPDDGKVSVESTKVEGMCSFIELPVTHALMMRSSTVIEQVQHYLLEGHFSGEAAINGLCSPGRTSGAGGQLLRQFSRLRAASATLANPSRNWLAGRHSRHFRAVSIHSLALLRVYSRAPDSITILTMVSS